MNDPFVGATEGFVVDLDEGRYTAVGLREIKNVNTWIVALVQRGDSRSVGDRGELIVGGEVVAIDRVRESRPIANITPGPYSPRAAHQPDDHPRAVAAVPVGIAGVAQHSDMRRGYQAASASMTSPSHPGGIFDSVLERSSPRTPHARRRAGSECRPAQTGR
jgi:hypothetical protein